MARSKSEMIVLIQNTGKTWLAEQGIESGLTVKQHANIIARFVSRENPEQKEMWDALQAPGVLNTSAWRQYFEKEGILEKKTSETAGYVA